MNRPYSGISPTRELRDTYDVVVIGAGIAGLIAANLLAKQNLRVLLVEQHYVVGGYCSTFRRKGFTFDAASHFYPLLGNESSLTGRLLADLGVRTEWIKMDPVDQFHLPDGTCFSVPSDFEGYIKGLHAKFPNESDNIDRFFKTVRKLYLLGLLHYFQECDTRRIDKYLDVTLREALDQHFNSKILKLLLTADCPHWGSTPSRTSFVFDSMLRLSYFQGNYYPVGGSQNFADDLARCLEERGGHILTKSQVNKIIVEKNRAVGIIVETGPIRSRILKRIAVDAVVSNADMRQTAFKMVGREFWPLKFVKRLDELRTSFPCFLSHIGVRGVSTELLRRVHGYYWSGWNSDRVGKDAFKCKIFVPTLYEPGMAPHGGHVIVIQKVTDVDFHAIKDWPEHKRSVEEFVLGHLGSLIPNIQEKIVVCLSASAKTSHRFTLNCHGAMLGWEMSPDQLGAHRPGIKSPIERLYFAGQWTRPGGGITPVIISAMRAAEKVIAVSSESRLVNQVETQECVLDTVGGK